MHRKEYAKAGSFCEKANEVDQVYVFIVFRALFYTLRGQR
jgi:hypothetical protein